MVTLEKCEAYVFEYLEGNLSSCQALMPYSSGFPLPKGAQQFLSAVKYFRLDSYFIFGKSLNPCFFLSCVFYRCMCATLHTRTHTELWEGWFSRVTSNLFNQSCAAPAVRHEVFPNYLNVICSLLSAATLLITMWEDAEWTHAHKHFFPCPLHSPVIG